MIALAQRKPQIPRNNSLRRPKQAAATWQEGYLKLLPQIRRQASVRLRHLSGEVREDTIQEILADTCVIYARLAELGKEQLAYASPLVGYAIAKYSAGRRVGGHLNGNDVMSPYCQRCKGVVVERLHCCGDSSDSWNEILVEDRHASPADVAAIRIDFNSWLKSLPARTRNLAKRLATGESTKKVAQMFGVSAGRVSQLRRSLRESWYAFVGEPLAGNA